MPTFISTEMISSLNKSAVGLSNVDNTSDANKPISTAQQTALNLKESLASKGVANGYAPLGADGLVPSVNLPANGSYKGNWDASNNTPTITAGTGTNGDTYTVSVAGTQSVTGSSTAFAVGDQLKYTTNGNKWERIPNTQAVSSVAGLTGTILPGPLKTALVLSKADVGLANVDNTSDLNKPISTAHQAALNTKQTTLVSGTSIKTVAGLTLLGSGDLGTIPITYGGTGAIDAPTARANLDARQDQTSLSTTQAVLTANATPVSAGEYFGSQFRATRLKPGLYSTSPLTIDKAQALIGDQTHGTALTLALGGNASLLTINASPDTDPVVQSDISHPTISGLMLNGYSGGQTGTSHILHFPAPAWSMSTRYSVGGKIDDLLINGAKNNGIRIETNRNFGFIDRNIVRYSGDDNLYLASYDNRIINSEFGNSQTAAGINFSSGGGNFLSHVSTYLNATYGTVIGPFVNQTNADIGGCHDSNYHGGTYLDAGSQAHMMNAIVAKRFQGNSKSADGVYSDIVVKNSPTPQVLVGNMHSFYGATRPKYLVEFDSATSFAHFSAVGYSTSSIPWVSSISNYPQNLILAGNQNIRLSFSTGTADTLGVWAGASETFRFTTTQNTSKIPLKIEGSAPYFRLDNTASGLDAKKWRFDISGNDLRLMTQNDGETVANFALLIRRSSSSISELKFGAQTDNAHFAFRVAVTTSQINSIGVTGAVTGQSPIIFAEGDDTNVGIDVKVKAAGTGRLLDGSNTSKFSWNTTGVGFFGATPVAKQSVSPEATDAATTQALVNAIRTALINYGIVV